MKIPKYAYMASALLMSILLIGKHAEAATSYVTTTASITNGTALTIRTESYTSISGELIEATDVNGTMQSWFVYDPTFAVTISNLNQEWLNGYLNFDVKISVPSMINIESFTVELLNEEGIKVCVYPYGETWFRIGVFFDNYYNRNGTDTVAVIHPHYIDTETAYSATSAVAFTTTLSVVSSNIEKSLVIQNNRNTALLYSAITQATGQQLSDIISMLTAIKSQDLTYYVSIVNQLSQLHTDNQQLHTDLTGILNELDLDFQAVQTVLDLFPSYRTAVLQYWQDLLQMNTTQSSEAADMESQYQDKEQQSESLSNSMNSVVMPTISGQDLDILGNIDTNAKTNFFGLIALITHNQLITKIMLVIVIGSFVGYIMYGKKQ